MWLKRVVSFINSISQINECSLAQQVIYANTVIGLWVGTCAFCLLVLFFCTFFKVNQNISASVDTYSLHKCGGSAALEDGRSVSRCRSVHI